MEQPGLKLAPMQDAGTTGSSFICFVTLLAPWDSSGVDNVANF